MERRTGPVLLLLAAACAALVFIALALAGGAFLLWGSLGFLAGAIGMAAFKFRQFTKEQRY